MVRLWCTNCSLSHTERRKHGAYVFECGGPCGIAGDVFRTSDGGVGCAVCGLDVGARTAYPTARRRSGSRPSARRGVERHTYEGAGREAESRPVQLAPPHTTLAPLLPGPPPPPFLPPLPSKTPHDSAPHP